MKKISLIICAIAISCGISACGKKTTDANMQNNDIQTTAPAAQETQAAADKEEPETETEADKSNTMSGDTETEADAGTDEDIK